MSCSSNPISRLQRCAAISLCLPGALPRAVISRAIRREEVAAGPLNETVPEAARRYTQCAACPRTAQRPHSRLADVLPKMAQAPGISVEDLLIVGNEKPLKKKAANTNNRPAGKMREVFDRVSKLPRRQQGHIVNWVSASLFQYEQPRQSYPLLKIQRQTFFHLPPSASLHALGGRRILSHLPTQNKQNIPPQRLCH